MWSSSKQPKKAWNFDLFALTHIKTRFDGSMGILGKINVRKISDYNSDRIEIDGVGHSRIASKWRDIKKIKVSHTLRKRHLSLALFYVVCHKCPLLLMPSYMPLSHSRFMLMLMCRKKRNIFGRDESQSSGNKFN